MSILALDVGEKRIGIAVSDPSDTFSLPLDVLERTAIRDDVRRIVEIASERGVQVIVVGDPVRLGRRTRIGLGEDRPVRCRARTGMERTNRARR